MLPSLEHIALFRGIAPKDAEELLPCLKAYQKHFKKGETILPEGAASTLMGVVLAGRAIIALGDVWGNSSVFGSVGAGQTFAEAYACIPDEPMLVGVVAAEDTTVLFLNAHALLHPCTHPCAHHMTLLRNLLTVCAGKNVQLSRHIQHTTPKSIRGRLLSYFSECSKRHGSRTFTIPYNRQQLADYLGVDRSALSNELSKMQRDGLLSYRKNQFTLHSPE